MRYRIGVVYVVILMMLTSCKKMKFPDKSDLIGSWTEQTDNTFKNKLVFDESKLYFYKVNSTDTLSYHIDKKDKLIYLSHPTNGSSSHEISINRDKSRLTIYGLFPGTPENGSQTSFIRD